MRLEDHLGDVIRKARTAANVGIGAAANASGLTTAELSVLEQSGTSSKRPDFALLAELIGLHPKKLEGIAKGWRPQPQDLSRWREPRQSTTTQNSITVNCYLI